MLPETTVFKRNSQYMDDDEEGGNYHDGYNNMMRENPMDPRWRSQAQNRNRHQQYIQDQGYYSALPTKKRKDEASMYEQYTPKRTLVYPKDEAQDNEENNDEYWMQKMEKGYDNFATPHANRDKKINVKIEKMEDYTPSPGKFNLSAKRAKRNVKLYSQFDPEEYELAK